jgi:predicted ester cyclase
MTLLETYRGFTEALRERRYDDVSRFVDPVAYTETCVGLTGWTVGLDVALANYQFGVAVAFADFRAEEQDVIEGPDALVLRSRNEATHVGSFLGIEPTGKRVTWDALDMYRAGDDGRIAWRFLLCDWNGVRVQLRGGESPLETPVRWAIQAPPGHPLARPA